MKNAIYLVTIIVFGLTQVPTEVLAKSPPLSSTQDSIPATPPPPGTQDSIPATPPPPSMREGTRITPLMK